MSDRIIGLGRIELLALAMAAIVEGDDPPAGLRQRVDPARIDPVDRSARGEAMDQQDRLAAVRPVRRATSIKAMRTPSEENFCKPGSYGRNGRDGNFLAAFKPLNLLMGPIGVS